MEGKVMNIECIMFSYFYNDVLDSPFNVFCHFNCVNYAFFVIADNCIQHFMGCEVSFEVNIMLITCIEVNEVNQY